MSGRKPAFDPSRLDSELDELLPPPSASPGQPAQAYERSVPSTSTAPKPATPSPEQTSSRSSRGIGGRPSGSAAGARALAVSAVRVPKPLYDAVVHDLLGASVERPSYAQVIAWTCEDHADEVVTELTHALQTAGRQPRGRKLASDGVPLTLRFKTEERAALDEVMGRVGGVAVKVTRTAAVIAALRVAVKYGVGAPSPR